MRTDFRISKCPKGGTVIITTPVKPTSKKLTDFFLRIDAWCLKFGEYKVECYYLTPRDASSFDFKTNVPYELITNFNKS